MKCKDFQKIIPEILDDTVPDEMLTQVVEHIDSCKECYDELEIYFVLQNGLDDNANSRNMNYIAELESVVAKLRKRLRSLQSYRAAYIFINIMAYTVISGSVIYVFFKYFL